MERRSGAGTIAGVLAGTMALAAACGDGSSEGSAFGPGATDAGLDGAPGEGGGGLLGDDSSSPTPPAPGPPRLLFAKSIPAGPGPAAPLPGGGWAVLVEILHDTVIAGTTIPRVGRDDAALVALNATGDPVWARPISGPGDDKAVALAVDDTGNLYVAGLSIAGNTIDFGGGITAATPAASNAQWAWFAKFDGTGAAQWAHAVGSDLGVGSVHIAARGGNVAVSGLYDEPDLRYAGTAGVIDAPAFGVGQEVFVLSCGAADGLATSLARLDGASTESGVAFDSAGHAVVAGSFGAAKLTKEPSGDVAQRVGSALNAYVVAVDAWGRAWGSVAPDTGLGVAASGLAADAQGHLVVAGAFGAATDFGMGARAVLGGTTDPFLAELDPTTGNTLWDKEIATSGDEGLGYVALDGAGNVATMGTLTNTAAPSTIDGVTLPTSPATYVAKLAPAPRLHWVRSAAFTPPASAEVVGIAANVAGDVLVTGVVHGTINLGGDTLTSSDSGFDDMYVLGIGDP